MILAKRISCLHYAIRDIVLEAKKEEALGKKLTYLNIGDPCQYGFKPPSHIVDAISDAFRSGKWHGYAPSEGDAELRKVIGEKEKLEASDIFITSGLSEGIDFMFQALMNSGDNFLLPSPGYPLYNTKSDIYEGIQNYYLCDEKYEPDIEDMRKKINERTKAIVVINPNNPTGKVYSYKTLKDIANLAGEFNIPIIADEIYDKLVFDGKFHSLSEFAGDLNVIRGNGLSKVFIYPGARLGYLAFHGDGLEKLKQATQKLANARLCTNWEIQRGAISAFTEPYDIEPVLNQFKLQRDVAYNILNETKNVETVKPEGAFYMFIKIKGPWKTDTEFVLDLLKNTGILVVPGSGFSPIIKEKCFRIVFLPNSEVLSGAMNKIKDFINKKV
ncbi:aminotransferase class I/II-fold pyridoxal phosphate-dependent enzyme [Candidatus Micrarchaeota archaeon]|nr:aminotransferase class I/II-fold pyridoxal phosphate-dependent enzyme [Candidatus Micrarchaeota archaeon]